MGRQLAVVLSDQDEADFLSFLNGSADIQIFRTSAPSRDGVFVDSFGPRGAWNWSYDIWNRAFPWEPILARTRLDLPDLERRGLYYISNKSTAPIIEYSRPVPGPDGMNGRIYWANDFSAPNGLRYDVRAFEVWYESVFRWLRKRKRNGNTL
jgi:hypothetical protein